MTHLRDLLHYMLAELLLACAKRRGALIYLHGDQLIVGNSPPRWLEAAIRERETQVKALLNEHFLGF
jgi:hypothetical protein